MGILLHSWWDVPVHHDLAQLVVARADVLHEHLEGGQLVLGGQWVELLLLHLLQLDSMPQLPHQLHPQPGPVCVAQAAQLCCRPLLCLLILLQLLQHLLGVADLGQESFELHSFSKERPAHGLVMSLGFIGICKACSAAPHGLPEGAHSSQWPLATLLLLLLPPIALVGRAAAAVL